jgi:hypothetical protein
MVITLSGQITCEFVVRYLHFPKRDGRKGCGGDCQRLHGLHGEETLFVIRDA